MVSKSGMSRLKIIGTNSRVLRRDLGKTRNELAGRMSRNSGCYLVSGPPGAGKSTLLRLVIDDLLTRPNERVLFTTYTAALAEEARRYKVENWKHVGERLQIDHVDVIVRHLSEIKLPCIDELPLFDEVFSSAVTMLHNSALSDPSLIRTLDRLIERLGDRYIRDEIEKIIIGHNIVDLTDTDSLIVTVVNGSKTVSSGSHS